MLGVEVVMLLVGDARSKRVRSHNGCKLVVGCVVLTSIRILRLAFVYVSVAVADTRATLAPCIIPSNGLR